MKRLLALLLATMLLLPCFLTGCDLSFISNVTTPAEEAQTTPEETTPEETTPEETTPEETTPEETTPEETTPEETTPEETTPEEIGRASWRERV